MSEEQKDLLPPHLAENARENIWIYRTYQGLSRKSLADAPLKSGTIRAYEYGFQAIHPTHLAIISEKLGMSVDALTAPPDYALLLDWQTRRIIEYYRRLNNGQRHALKLLMMRMG